MNYLFLVLTLVLVGCTQVNEENTDKGLLPDSDVDTNEVDANEFMKQKAINLCVKKCQEYSGDLSSGPCLDGDIVNNWACDVAHNPRQEVDNKVENQCESYRDGTSSYFVEITSDCELIRTG